MPGSIVSRATDSRHADCAGSPAAIRAAAAVAVSIGHLAAALLVLRKPASSSEPAPTQPLPTLPPTLAHEAHKDFADSLDAMYPKFAAQGTYAVLAASSGKPEPNLRSTPQGLEGNPLLAMALSRAGRPALLHPRSGALLLG